MTATMKLNLKVLFADETSSTITIDNINPSVGVNPNIRAIIRQFNDSEGGTLTSKLKSKNGANWIKITKAESVVTNRDYIF